MEIALTVIVCCCIKSVVQDGDIRSCLKPAQIPRSDGKTSHWGCLLPLTSSVVGVICRQSLRCWCDTPPIQSMARMHECKDCPLNHGESHQVPDRDVEHRVLVARYRVDATAAAPQQSPRSVDQLAELMTGITLTDEGPNVRQQPSKFFSSRDEFQDGAEIPTSPTPVLITIAQQSIQKVLHSVKHPGMRSVERNQGLLLDIRKQV
jgi:hypothetical protein